MVRNIKIIGFLLDNIEEHCFATIAEAKAFALDNLEIRPVVIMQDASGKDISFRYSTPSDFSTAYCTTCGDACKVIKTHVRDNRGSLWECDNCGDARWSLEPDAFDIIEEDN